ncbi:MAG: hypothetical protein SFU83_22560 [Meiothermus sp.]|nr:hypothetical protein [Meiothermus sp.]
MGGYGFGLVLFFSLLFWLPFPLSFAQQTSRSANFSVQTFSAADQRLLPRVFEVLQQARRDLIRRGLRPPERVTLVIHPSLESYTRTTRLPWFIAAVADRAKARIDTQRLRVLIERGSLERTLRHELFHLAQPQDWPRWKAEGMAMRFAGDKPTAAPFPGISEAALERLLVDPPDQATLNRAMATAYRWAGRE